MEMLRDIHFLRFCKHLIYNLGFWIRQKDAEAVKIYNYSDTYANEDNSFRNHIR